MPPARTVALNPRLSSQPRRVSTRGGRCFPDPPTRLRIRFVPGAWFSLQVKNARSSIPWGGKYSLVPTKPTADIVLGRTTRG